jgi:N-carbamoylputrescine amidase
MPRQLTVAALQTHHDWNSRATVDRVLSLAHQAADQGAQLVLPSELFEAPYFCKTRNPRYRDLARPATDHPTIALFQKFARDRQVVVPVSFYERGEDGLYNSAAIVDADGSILGIYRKSHIPQFPAYEEDAFFTPSREGAKVWQTRYLKLGVGICWDQWFPELARMMTLMGAEMLVYPTAIGSEASGSVDWDSRDQWQTVMRGHAAANQIPVMASNRIGTETDDGVTLTFYGSSFICNQFGSFITEGSREREEVVLGIVDLDHAQHARRAWGAFDTRRPDIYGPLVDTPAGMPVDALQSLPL